MNNLLSKIKLKLKNANNNVKAKTIFISVFALLLIVCITLAWYINNLGINGVEFSTGNIEFNTYVYDVDGKRLIGPVSSNNEGESNYNNDALLKITNAQVGTVGTAYIAVESTGSLGIQYKIAFDITGRTDSADEYLGGYKYNITKVTDKVSSIKSNPIDVSGCSAPEAYTKEVITIDRNPVVGVIEDRNNYDIYRFDYKLVEKNKEYTGKDINIYFNIFATQIDGDFDDDTERGYTYYCSTKDDIDRAKVEAYPGDTIKLSSNIVYYGDLVFNKPINFEANDYKITINGNFMYDYVLANGLEINAGGLGQIVVQCAKDGIGGNFTIKAPLSEVTLAGSNSAIGDIVVEKKFTVDATNSFGSSGVSFNNVRIADNDNILKTILLESNTRATVSFGTKIGIIQSLVKTSNIEIINNGTINKIDLISMHVLPQTNSPQIYILNNNDINNPIVLPDWSEKFIEDSDGNCTGNTRIIQSLSGSPMKVTGDCKFTNNDIEIEKKDVLVEQINAGNDSELKIYYQDVVDLDGNTVTTSIKSILEDYFKNDVTTNTTINEVTRLEIISIGTKAVNNADITFIKNALGALNYLDMERANMYDTVKDVANRLPDFAFQNLRSSDDKGNVIPYNSIILPQNLTEIGNSALSNVNCKNIITIPSGVSTFGTNWFSNSYYVYFASSLPLPEADDGISKVKAIFVDEPYIESYKETFSAGYSDKIYPISVPDQSHNHFVRNIGKNAWEITYYISGEDNVIGEDVLIDGKIINITSIYANAYKHNFTGTSVKFADSVEYLGESNFYNKEVTYVDLNRIKTVESDVFNSCKGLTKVDSAGYIETISSKAFYMCSNLERFEFGLSLKMIGSYAFSNCESLSQDVILPDTMEKIDSYAFYMSAITGINTGGTKSIDSHVFNLCKQLIYAKLPKVEVIYADNSGINRVFEYASSLVSVEMPNLTKVNGKWMFYNCSSLKEIYLGVASESVSFGEAAFNITPKPKLFVPKENLQFFQNKKPGEINSEMIYPIGEKMGENLVNGFNIGEYIVFDNKDNTYSLITSNLNFSGNVSIPNTYKGLPIVEIFANAYRNQDFTNVNLTFGDNVKVIGDSAFRSLTGLIKVNFGDSLRIIDSNAFNNCSGLSQDLVLPDSMESIESFAFSYSAITGINTGGTLMIENGAFNYCTSLIYAELPNVTTVAASGKNEIFNRCNSLVSVKMPSLISYGGDKIFNFCTSLREVYMNTDNAGINFGPYTFNQIPSKQYKVFVPENLVSFYQTKLGGNMIYPQGEKLGDNFVNGYNIGQYIVLDKGNNTYSLVASNLSYTGESIVPNEYNGKPITDVYKNAFRNQTYVGANLKFGANLSKISDSAFDSVTGLDTVTIDNVTTIGSRTFASSSIAILNAPKLVDIGSQAFSSCTALGVINLPKIQNITNSNVFANCTNLKSVYFEDIVSLVNTTFTGCNKIEKITINRIIDGVTSNVPSETTISATAPCTIYVPYKSLSAYNSTWSGKQVDYFDLAGEANGDTYILGLNNEGKYQLIEFISKNTSRNELELPSEIKITESGENVTLYSIMQGAFSSASGQLKSIKLSKSIGQFTNDAFSECVLLESFTVASDNPFFTSIDGILYSKDGKMLMKYPVAKTVGDFDMTGELYNSTVGIGAGAFNNVSKLTGIKFPSSLVVIDSNAFTNCKNLATVEFTNETAPPTLMGTGIFDTSVDDFSMVIPTSNSEIVSAYLCAFNFAEYEPYINIGDNSAPDSSTDRNQVPINSTSNSKTVFALINTGKDDEEDTEDAEESTEEDTTSGDDPEKTETLSDTFATESYETTELTTE